MELKPTLIITIAIIMVIATTSQGVYASSKHLTDDQRYNSGYKDGIKDCGQSDVVYQYKQSSAYLGHSDLYQQGYDDGSQHCYTNNDNPSYGNTNPGGSDITHYSKVSGNNNQNADNSNQDNRNQPQAESNKQKVICIVAIGTCGGATSGQSQGLTN